jgi:hypothetical protein
MTDSWETQSESVNLEHEDRSEEEIDYYVSTHEILNDVCPSGKKNDCFLPQPPREKTTRPRLFLRTIFSMMFFTWNEIPNI